MQDFEKMFSETYFYSLKGCTHYGMIVKISFAQVYGR